MKEILILNKNVSETPLECLERFRVANPEYQNAKMTYAGRLDPMASGLLVVLAGDMVHKKEEFLKLPKTYEVTVVLGIESDTFDCLGVIVRNPPLHKGRCPELARGGGVGVLSQSRPLRHSPEAKANATSPYEGEDFRIIESLHSFIGTYSQTYPSYSSKTINGKQMHSLARASELPDAGLPNHMVTVTDISNIHIQEIPIEEIIQDVIPKIRAVKGDFRQEEIVDCWEKLTLSLNSDPSVTSYARATSPYKGEDSHHALLAVSFTMGVSGGTYIRAIADELGKKLGTGGILWKLHRTKVGDFSLDRFK